MKNAFSKPLSLFDRWFLYLSRRSPSERLFLRILCAVFVGAAIVSAIQFNQSFLTTQPGTGGIYTEGMIGAPRFINPVLAITRVDQDLSALLFAGLMKLDVDGNLVPNLAESITISDDGTVYSVVLKDNLTFSDGLPLTTEDVAFTIDLIKKPDLKSPLRGSWNDVETEIVSEKEMNFVLSQAYSPFIENLTVGIIPKQIWKDLTPEEFPFSQKNTEPVGSGLYQVSKVTRSGNGLISQYELTARSGTDTQVRIPTITIHFYSNEEEVLTALQEKKIQASASISNDRLASLDTKVFSLYEYPLPRVFGLFINQNKSPALRDGAAREALKVLVDREALIDSALSGWGKPTDIPVPTGFHGLQSEPTQENNNEKRVAAARAILQTGGWKESGTGLWEKTIDGTSVSLTLNLATANNPYLVATAQFLKESWRDLGVDVEIALYEQADLVQSVIRPRNYEMVLSGNDVGRSLDLFPFWHSSQREDPGLNISLYTNISADDTLEAFRETRDSDIQQGYLGEIVARIKAENPAIFLYNPSFVYVVDSTVSIQSGQRISKPSDRFATVSDWYLTEESVWPLFTY